MHTKALRTKDSASIYTNDIIFRRRQNSFYNDVDETLGKPNHYTIVMEDLNAQIGKRTNPMETATGKFGLNLRNARGDTLIEWATPRNYKIKNTIFHKNAGRRWMWKSPNGVTKTEMDYTQTEMARLRHRRNSHQSTKSTLEVTTVWL